MKQKTYIIFLGFLGLLFYVNKTFFLGKVDSISMSNTLKEGDNIIFTKSTKNKTTVKNNDIILFKRDNKILIKRCVGLPNDTIKIINDTLFVNNKKAANEFYLRSNNKISNSNKTLNSYLNFVVPFNGYKIILNNKNLKLYQALIENNEGVKIKKIEDNYFVNKTIMKYYVFRRNYYFVTGDNWFNSFDSRHFGPVSQDDIYGELLFNF